MLTRLLVAASCLLHVHAVAAAQLGQSRIDVPVLAGNSDELDACDGQGTIVGLDPKGDGFLSVRSGPGGKYREIDRLYNGMRVHLCDLRGVWLGVVYSPRDPQDTCNVTTPWPRREAYTGPCRYGWIHSRYVSTREMEGVPLPSCLG